MLFGARAFPPTTRIGKDLPARTPCLRRRAGLPCRSEGARAAVCRSTRGFPPPKRPHGAVPRADAGERNAVSRLLERPWHLLRIDGRSCATRIILVWT